MVALVSPGGTKVEVDTDLAEVLTGQGWGEAEKVPRKTRGASPAKPPAKTSE